MKLGAKNKMKHLLNSITLLLLSTLAFGQVPNTFSSGETISSSKINANFAYLAESIKNGNISAMMVCQSAGYNNDDNKFYYGKCSSTDNQTFGTQSLYLYMYDRTNNQAYISSSNTIGLNELFSNKWLLYNSNWGAHSSGVFQKHVFYKVFSD